MVRVLTRKRLIGLAALGSALLLALAFGFQYLGGFLPCAMCLWQRWPHVVAILLGALGWALPLRGIAGLGATSMGMNAGLGLYHTGVERNWWEGPSTCSGSAAQDLTAMSGGDLLDFTTGPQIVLCDQAAWHFIGLSMASWNAICCVLLAGLWVSAIRAPRAG